MKGYIYAIRSHQTSEIYIGSTTQMLCNRMTGHRADCKQWKNGKTKYVTSFEILKYDDAYIELILEVEVVSKLELRKIEGENIRKHNCVNKNIAGRTSEGWRHDNKEHIAEQKAENKEHITKYGVEFYKDHKEIILAKQAVPFTCICGSICRTGNKSQHKKSKKHQSFILLNPIIQDVKVDVDVFLQPLKSISEIANN